MTMKITKNMQKIADKLGDLLLAGWMDTDETVYWVLKTMRDRAVRQKDAAAIKFLDSYLKE